MKFVIKAGIAIRRVMLVSVTCRKLSAALRLIRSDATSAGLFYPPHNPAEADRPEHVACDYCFVDAYASPAPSSVGHLLTLFRSVCVSGPSRSVHRPWDVNDSRIFSEIYDQDFLLLVLEVSWLV